MEKNKQGRIKRLLFSIIVSVIVLILIYLFILSPTTIAGTSMEPILQNDDQILINKEHYYLSDPQRGDIIVFKLPNDDGIDYISRIIAIGGDTIQIKAGKVYLNNLVLNESYILGVTMPSTDDGTIKEGEIFKIPVHTIFAMSDNRQHSFDSRNFGIVPVNNLIGKPILRFLPVNRFGLLEP